MLTQQLLEMIGCWSFPLLRNYRSAGAHPQTFLFHSVAFRNTDFASSENSISNVLSTLFWEKGSADDVIVALLWHADGF